MSEFKSTFVPILNSDIYNWVNFIEEFKVINGKEYLEKYKNYLRNKFDEKKIINSNKKLFNEIFEG